jgi:hypothetical protein
MTRAVVLAYPDQGVAVAVLANVSFAPFDDRAALGSCNRSSAEDVTSAASNPVRRYVPSGLSDPTLRPNVVVSGPGTEDRIAGFGNVSATQS